MENTLVKVCGRIAVMMTVALLPAGCAVGTDDPIPQETATDDLLDGGVDSEARDADAAAIESEIVAPIAEQLPVVGERRRGFNLTGKFILEDANTGFDEQQFQLMRDLGFNYARLPLDYRTYTKPGDWYAFDAPGVKQIDQAVAFGQQYGIHVSLNLHRAPGFCVHDDGKGTGFASWVSIPENQKLDLWTDEAAQKAFIAHWLFFAKRYQKLSNEYLSFNLVNEPMAVTEEVYLAVMQRTIDAIRQVTPDRTVVVDGFDLAEKVTPAFAALDAVLSKHSYEPKSITHYNVPWWPESSAFPVPVWPPTTFLSPYLCGHYKEADGLNVPLVIQGDFAAGTVLTLHVEQVSTENTVELLADDAVFYTKVLDPSGETEPWAEVVYVDDLSIYQSLYDHDIGATLPADASKLAIFVPDGDWMTFSKLGITPPGGETMWFEPTIADWGVPQATFALTADNTLLPAVVPAGFESYYEINDGLDDWRAISATGVKVMIGELGVYKNTPHDVTLALLEYKLQAFQAAGFDWCLWNLIGDFGFFNSGRADVDYEDYEGLALDREMLELLARY